MKNILKLFISSILIAALFIFSHASALTSHQQLCQLDEQHLNTELALYAQLGPEHINSVFSYLDTQCQPGRDIIQLSDDEDREPPKITSWQLSSNEVDLSSGDQTITLTVKAYDESGVASMVFGLVPPNRSYPFPTNRVALTQWTQTDEKHVYEATGTITLKTTSDIGGIWRAAVMFLRDSKGHYRVYTSASMLKKMGFNPYVMVTNTTLIDSMAPQLRGYSLSSTSVNVDDGQQTVTLEVFLHDDSGVQEAVVSIAPPEEHSATIGRTVPLADWQTTSQNGVYKASAELSFNSNDVAGEWRTSILWAYDTDKKNQSSISEREIRDLGFFPNIKVINSSEVDATPPKLVSLTVSDNSLSISEGQQQVTAQVKFYEPSGLSSGYISLVSPSGDYRDNKLVNITEWQTDPQPHVFVGNATFTFDKTDHVGVWHVKSWWVRDNQRNQFDGSKIEELIVKGINPYVFFNVADENIADLYISTSAKTIEGRLNKPEQITLSFKELAGKALPNTFAILVTGTLK